MHSKLLLNKEVTAIKLSYIKFCTDEVKCKYNGDETDIFVSVVGFSGSADRMAWPPSWKIQMAISPWQIIRFTPCLVLGWRFRGWQIEWH